MLNVGLSLLIGFFVCVLVSPVLIPFLRKLKFGQEILEIGPNWHKDKKGTPTMGGIAFILAIGIAISVVHLDLKGYLVFAFAFLCGVIGFTDDFIKVHLKRNMGFPHLDLKRENPRYFCKNVERIPILSCSEYLNLI